MLGNSSAKIAKVHSYLQQQNTLPVVPSRSVVQHIITKELGMRYRASLGAKVMYNDPTYDEKRLWVSRLLAQLHLEGAVIISLDESSFK